MQFVSRRFLAIVALAVAGTGPAFAYDDEPTYASILSLFGVSMNDNPEKIDFRERPKLVLPSAGPALPEPTERGAQRPESWPVDEDVVRRRNALTVAREPAPQPGLRQNPTLSPRELSGRGGAREARRGGDSECLNSQQRECLLMSAEEAKIGTKEAENRSSLVAGDEPKREYLTEPPAGFRRPTKEVKPTPEAPSERADWSNPLAYLREQAGGVLHRGE